MSPEEKRIHGLEIDLRRAEMRRWVDARSVEMMTERALVAENYVKKLEQALRERSLGQYIEPQEQIAEQAKLIEELVEVLRESGCLACEQACDAGPCKQCEKREKLIAKAGDR